MTPSRSHTGLSITAIVAGALAALVGIAVAVVGALLLGVFGSDGTVASGNQPLSSSRSALVSSVADIDDVAELADVVGDPRLHVSATSRSSEADVFVGIGPAAQVDRYLAGAPIDEVTDLEVDPFELKRRPRGGSSQPAPPGSQDFWVAEATARSTAALRWKIRDGDYRLVLMNADGSRPVDTDGELKLYLPDVAGIAWALTGAGLLLTLGGAAGIVLGARGRRRHLPEASAAGRSPRPAASSLR
jgi:hypothetical protein